MSTMIKGQLQSYAKAGAVAGEVISSVRTVQAFGGEKKESARSDCVYLRLPTRYQKKPACHLRLN
jgi:hypothetical protein